MDEIQLALPNNPWLLRIPQRKSRNKRWVLLVVSFRSARGGCRNHPQYRPFWLMSLLVFTIANHSNHFETMANHMVCWYLQGIHHPPGFF